MKVIIIGGVAGGASAAARLRRLDEQAEIILVERGESISYANCGLPYHLGNVIPDRNDLLVMTPEKFNARFRVDVRTRCEAVSIDRVNKKIILRDLVSGSEVSETYDKLILSTGSSPAPVSIPGADHPGVFHLWTLADMDKLEAHIRNGAEKVLVIGGGFVGLELAENLNERKLEVTLIQRGRQLLPTLDYEMSSLLVTELRRQGIRVEMDTEVTSFQPEGKGFSAILSNGRELPADTAVLSIGVKPNSELAKTAGLELGTRGHIVTDQELRTSDPDIYAVGDVIEVTDPIFGGRTAIALAGPANRQGRMAADNITGRHSQYKGTIGTSVIKVGRLTAGMTGYSERRLASMDVPYHKIYLHPNSNASYYPGGAQLHMKVIFGHDGKLFGAQIVGAKGVDKRIDVISSAVWNGKKIQELAELELAYAPPYASAKDPVNLAGMIGENVIGGLTRLAHFDSLPDGCFLLDVREKAEFELGSLPGARNIPLGDLRKRLAELPRGRMIYIFCQSGLRGYVAERILAQHSFDAVNLSGGYLTWKMFQPLQATPPDPVKKETGRPVLAVCKKQLDVRALACPGPVVRLKQEMDNLNAGESLELLAPQSFDVDLMNWIKSSGNELVSQEMKTDYLYAIIRRRIPGAESHALPAAPAEQTGAIVLFSNDLDKAMAALIIACGMAASGMKVGIFFTFWGLSVLRRNPAPPVRKNALSKMFGWMLPKGASRLKLSKMNMGGLGTGMMKHVMAQQNVATLPDLLKQAKALGVKFIACEMAMNVMGISREELVEVDEVAGVASFVELAKQNGRTLFI